jgi:acyl transferase domain-containing protein
MHARVCVLLLPGQGSQRPRMATGLYGALPLFTEAMDDFFTRTGAEGAALRAHWLRSADGDGTGLDEAAVAQPLLLALGYALGRQLGFADGTGDVLIGHSDGELAAACLAGVFGTTSAEAGAAVATLAAGRTGAFAGAPEGGMLAVACAPAELPGDLGPGVAVAAYNGPRQTVLAGPATALAATARRLRAAGRLAVPLRADLPFHAPAMAETARRFGATLAALGPRPPRPGVHVYSTRTGAPLTPAQAADPAFWSGQLAEPVRYWPALRALLDAWDPGRPGPLLLDASADGSLGAPARRHRVVRAGGGAVLPLLAAGTGGEDLPVFADALRRLRDAGVTRPGAQAAASLPRT